jgi:hypothetical protein
MAAMPPADGLIVPVMLRLAGVALSLFGDEKPAHPTKLIDDRMHMIPTSIVVALRRCFFT